MNDAIALPGLLTRSRVQLCRRGHTPEDAQDLTQAFFTRLIERNLFAVADPNRGRFRTFLLTALRNFLIRDHKYRNATKRGGGIQPLPLPSADPEARYQAEPADPATPDLLFERRWVLTVLENALARLRQEYAEAGRGPWFDQLRDFVWGQKNDLTHADVTRQLDLTPDAVKKSVLRLRDRFRDALRVEISHTVMTPSEVDQEMRHLIEILRR